MASGTMVRAEGLRSAGIGDAVSTAAVAVAVDDAFATTSAALFSGNVLANDQPGTGSAILTYGASTEIPRYSDYNTSRGGFVSVNLATGDFVYDPNGAFAGLAPGASVTDSFFYKLANGSTAIVTMTITGVPLRAPDSSGTVTGTAGNDSYTANITSYAPTYVDFSQGGDDAVSVKCEGARTYYFGAALTATDRVSGGYYGARVVLEGDNSGSRALVLAPTTLFHTSLELRGAFDYDITTNDANFDAVGGSRYGYVDAQNVSGTLRWDGSAETLLGFNIKGAAGGNVLIGGAGANWLVGAGGRDELYGGADTDLLWGNAGDDVLDGRGGRDTLYGGTGDDVYYVDDPFDSVIEYQGQGDDRVFASVSYDLSRNGGSFVEALYLTGTSDINATGTNQANRLYGNDGNNIIDGKMGADVMAGGKGDDTYYVDNAGDKVVELLNEGNDTIFSSVTYDLAAQFIETLRLTGTANINAYGNSQANALYGNDGANLIDGRGGADVMTGGKGDDTYYVDNAGDKVIELFNEGNDTIFSSVTYDLTAQYIETLRLTGTAKINAYGNSQANALYGNDGANLIDGRGGADVMAGGKGDDLYIVDNAGDQVIEQADGGIDQVNTTVDYVLPANVENVALLGSGDIAVIGNEMPNVFGGNAGANVLTGGGGNDSFYAGGCDDTMIGGAGNDLLSGDDGFDTTVYSGALAGYRLTVADSFLRVTDIDLTNGDDGSDRLVGVEALRFADVTIDVDAAGFPDYGQAGGTFADASLTYAASSAQGLFLA